jgi:cation diffusion facilitator family transporter
MHAINLERWQHTHTFGTDVPASGERRTRWVIALTAIMMVLEIAAGVAFGSMALLADGWHMATHAAALTITVFAYVYARRHAGSEEYSFGTGKVGALGGFGSAVGLAVVALYVLVESTERLFVPTAIHFDEAIYVAVVGLLVNLGSAFLLREHHEHDDHHEHGHEDHHEHHDHNLRAAYFHVLADALTSVLAIIALTAGKLVGWRWMDPVMGLVGSIVIARWSYALLRDSGRVLLDAEVGEQRRSSVKAALEVDDDTRVADLHLWRVGPRHLAAIISVVTHEPKEPEHYKARLQGHDDLVHLTVEVHRCTDVGGTSCTPNAA